MRQKILNFGHEEVNYHDLGMMVGLANKYFQGMGEFHV
jgi:hypothetical protein